MIKFPSHLEQTLCCFYTYQWPALDEDQILVHASSWLDAEKTILEMVDHSPAAEAGTIWDPNVQWDRGQDASLDAFIAFWENYPRAHHYLAAQQARLIAWALNAIAKEISDHKFIAIKALQSAYDELSQNYHLLGASHSLFGINFLWIHWGSEYGDNETADRHKADDDIVEATRKKLKNLSDDTHTRIEEYVKVLDKAREVFDGIASSAMEATNALPDQSYENWNTMQAKEIGSPFHPDDTYYSWSIESPAARFLHSYVTPNRGG